MGILPGAFSASQTNDRFGEKLDSFQNQNMTEDALKRENSK